MTLSLSTAPSGPQFSRSALLTALTATSARPFEDGWWAEESLCRTPQFLRKSSNSFDVYSGPPSLEISTGTPLFLPEQVDEALGTCLGRLRLCPSHVDPVREAVYRDQVVVARQVEVVGRDCLKR